MDNKTPSRDRERIYVPAPILTIFHIMLAILLQSLLPLPIPRWFIIPWVGLGLAAIGFILGVLALIEFRRVHAAVNRKRQMAGFVTSGIYHYTRNPVYLGFVFLLTGLTLSVGTYWGIILAWSLVILLNNLVINPEEISLERRFKNQYLDYKSKVRRWL